MSKTIGTIKQAIEDIKNGKMIVLLDDEDRENEGDLVIASNHATPQAINFMAKEGRGLICLTLQPEDFDRLNIPMMTANNTSPRQTAFGAGFEAAEGITTGISAYDRAHSIKTAIKPNGAARDIIMPGHVFPLKAVSGGVLRRNGHTEGGSDLARLAGCDPTAVLCEIMNDDGTMARLPDILVFAQKHDLTVVTIKDLIDYRLSNESMITPGPVAQLPNHFDETSYVQSFYSERDQKDHVAVVSADLDPTKPCLVRIHSECLTGDVLSSLRCDCGAQLRQAQEELAKHNGVLIYLRQEGRGIGLAEKIKAYALQDTGLDTMEANEKLGFHSDLRDYGVAAQILKYLNIRSVRLMTNNPNKVERLQALGILVEERVPLEVSSSKYSHDYLKTKVEKMGHIIKINS